MLHIMGQDPGLEVPSSLLGDSGLSFDLVSLSVVCSKNFGWIGLPST